MVWSYQPSSCRVAGTGPRGSGCCGKAVTDARTRLHCYSIGALRSPIHPIQGTGLSCCALGTLSMAGGAGLCTRGTGPCRDTAPASHSSWGIVGTSLCGQPLPALLTLAHSREGMLLAELRAGCCPWQISRMAQGVEWGQPRQGPWGQRMAGSQSQLGWRKDCSGSEGLAPPFFWGEAGFV